MIGNRLKHAHRTPLFSFAVFASCAGLAAAQAIVPTGTLTNGGDAWQTSGPYGLQCSLGQSAVGAVTDAAGEVDVGFWYILWVADAPNDLSWRIDPGWNWIAVPTHPQFPHVGVVFDVDPVNRLFEWDWLRKTSLLYPDDFTTVENTVGYSLWLGDGMPVETVRHSGFLNRTPTDPASPYYRSTRIYIPSAGAITLGYPHPWPVKLDKIRVEYDGVIRTVLVDHYAPDPWVNWNWIYWDPILHTAMICTFTGGGGNDDTLRPWRHYRVWFNLPMAPNDPRGPYLIIPEP